MRHFMIFINLFFFCSVVFINLVETFTRKAKKKSGGACSISAFWIGFTAKKISSRSRAPLIFAFNDNDKANRQEKQRIGNGVFTVERARLQWTRLESRIVRLVRSRPQLMVTSPRNAIYCRGFACLMQLEKWLFRETSRVPPFWSVVDWIPNISSSKLIATLKVYWIWADLHVPFKNLSFRIWNVGFVTEERHFVVHAN